MYLGIKKVFASTNYQLILIFENDECRLFDVKPLLSLGRFTELKDIHLFETVSISFDTIEWENGLDLDPEYLYEKSLRISTDSQIHLSSFSNSIKSV